MGLLYVLILLGIAVAGPIGCAMVALWERRSGDHLLAEMKHFDEPRRDRPNDWAFPLKSSA